MAPRILLCCSVLALAGCGAEEEPAEPQEPSPATQLTVRVDPDGDGPEPAKEARVRSAAGVRPADLAPVPDDVACTEIFGGPQTARIRGTLEGREVDARFARHDGCEIARWERVAPLLEAAG